LILNKFKYETSSEIDKNLKRNWFHKKLSNFAQLVESVLNSKHGKWLEILKLKDILYSFYFSSYKLMMYNMWQ